MLSIPHKRCSSCERRLPLTAFGKKADASDGLQYQCKECIAAYAARTAERNRKRARQWEHDNRERKNERSRAYNKRQSDPVTDGVKTCAKCGETRPVADFAVERRRSDGRSPQCKRCIYPRLRVASHKRREAVRRSECFTVAEWEQLCAHYDHRCLCCGEQKPLTIDHIVPLSKGGSNTIDNLQPLCISCNDSKGTKTIDYRRSV